MKCLDCGFNFTDKDGHRGHKVVAGFFEDDTPFTNKEIDKVKEEIVRVGFEHCDPVSQDKCDRYVELYRQSKACQYCGATQILDIKVGDYTLEELAEKALLAQKEGYRVVVVDEKATPPSLPDASRTNPGSNLWNCHMAAFNHQQAMWDDNWRQVVKE